MKTATAFAAASSRNFQQTLDKARPHKYLESRSHSLSILTYQYTDSGELVDVPNLWSNQPLTLQVKTLDLVSVSLDRAADGLEGCPMLHRTAQENAQRVMDNRRRAKIYRLMAERLALLGDNQVFGSLQDLEASVLAQAA